MAQALRAVPTKNFLQTTLSSALSAGTTASASLTSVSGIQNLPGVFVVDRINAAGEETPTRREIIKYNAVSGSTVTTLTRNADSSGTDQDHAIGAIVEFVPDVIWAQSIYDGLSQVIVPSTGLLDTTKVVDLNTSQTLTNKSLAASSIASGTIATARLGSGSASSSTYLRGDSTWEAISTSSDGWISSSDSFTYVSSSSMKISGSDKTSVFTKGTRIKLTNSTTKYFVVTSSSFSTDTTINVTGGTDYTLASGAVTGVNYSYHANPQCYPGIFSYTPTFTGFSSDPGVDARFSVVGREVTVYVHATSAGTSNGTGFTITMPISAAMTTQVPGIVASDASNTNYTYSGTSIPIVARGEISSGSNVLTLYKDYTGTTWTGSGFKYAYFVAKFLF